jgi:hypothetical protein
MHMAGDGKEPVLDFMVVRAPEQVGHAAARRRYIRDRVLIRPKEGLSTHVPDDPLDPQALERVSEVGRIVYELVFISKLQPGPNSLEKLRDRLLKTLRPYKLAELTPPPDTPKPRTLRLDDLAEHAHISVGDLYYILPDRLEQLAGAPLIRELIRVRPILEAAQFGSTAFDPAALRGRLEKAFGKALPTVVFSADGHSADYASAHRALFESLYLLYLMRHWTTVDMSDLIDGLQLLHAIEALAVDALFTTVRAGTASSDDIQRMAALASTMPEFAGWDGKTDVAGIPAVTSVDVIAELLDARPIVHPLLVRLFSFREPFNDIKPIGVGDLKVVKQWLTGYLPGEISHIHNIMKGESRLRTHRRTERSEEVVSLSTSRTEDTTRESQTTERFEVKSEAENVVNTMLNVTANANLTYNNSAAMITASAGAGFAYTRATEDRTKTAQNFARDVVAKAVERIQTYTASQRTITQIFETEERNSQSFDNTDGDGHISGIYRWIDKEYTAQVYNYGKRLMFEFVVPQPAAFWVKSKLLAYENSLDVPQPSFPEPVREAATLPFGWAEINEKKFGELKAQYDLRDMTFPPRKKSVPLRNKQSRERVFKEIGVFKPSVTRTYDCAVEGGANYLVASMYMGGHIEFASQAAGNRLRVLLNDRMVLSEGRPNVGSWDGPWSKAPDETILLNSDEVTLTLTFGGELEDYDLTVRLELTLPDSGLEAFQRSVYDAVLKKNQDRLDARFQELKLAYDAEMSQYRNRLAQIRAVAVADLIAGKSEAANRLVIDEEIKKHCMTMVTKEFDTVSQDDRLSTWETLGNRGVTASGYRLKVSEAKKETERTRVGYEKDDVGTTVNYPAIAIRGSRDKGSVVQFLEQAFEWERLSYVFYPYFWSEQKDWVELMNREDDSDSTFTAFLRSGMARVLVAATPGYEDAVLYYLHTREPWAGGRSPVIGDPLFVSLHDELRQQTDDRSGGVPDGEPWTFTVPTSLVYLHGSKNALPNIQAERQASSVFNKESVDVTAYKTLSAADSGIVQNVTTDAVVVTLPAVSPSAVGLTYTIRNGAKKDGDILVTVSPNASDKIIGNGFTSADNKDVVNPKATSKAGDEITLVSNGSTGWFVSDVAGLWAREV